MNATAIAAPTRNGTLLAETNSLEASISTLENRLSSLEGELHSVLSEELPTTEAPAGDFIALPDAVDYIRNLDNRVNRVLGRIVSIRERLQLS